MKPQSTRQAPPARAAAITAASQTQYWLVADGAECADLLRGIVSDAIREQALRIEQGEKNQSRVVGERLSAGQDLPRPATR